MLLEQLATAERHVTVGEHHIERQRRVVAERRRRQVLTLKRL